jgi:hypothetical protein
MDDQRPVSAYRPDFLENNRWLEVGDEFGDLFRLGA